MKKIRKKLLSAVLSGLMMTNSFSNFVIVAEDTDPSDNQEEIVAEEENTPEPAVEETPEPTEEPAPEITETPEPKAMPEPEKEEPAPEVTPEVQTEEISEPEPSEEPVPEITEDPAEETPEPETPVTEAENTPEETPVPTEEPAPEPVNTPAPEATAEPEPAVYTLTFIAGENGGILMSNERPADGSNAKIRDTQKIDDTSKLVTVWAWPNPGYEFDHWVKDNQVFETKEAAKIQAEDLKLLNNDSFTAVFKLKAPAKEEEPEPIPEITPESEQEVTPEPVPEETAEPAPEATDEPAAEETPLPEETVNPEETQTEEVEEPSEEAEAAVEETITQILNIGAVLLGTTDPDTWTVTFYNRDAEVYRIVNVAKGEAIGDSLPAVIAREDYNAYWAPGEIVQGGQGNETRVTGERINSSWVPETDTTIVPDYDKVTYTVTFYQEDKTTVVATKTVNYETNYCVNDIPAVPGKTGHTGRWVYSGGNFNNSATISEDTAVWAEYDQKVFTVKFMVEGSEYKTDKYYYNDTLTLPTDPVVEGKAFQGWFIGETQYTGGETVTSDLTITASFEDAFKVDFVILDETGAVSERLSQYFRTEGEAIGQMPQNPFKAGKVFEKWVIEGTDTEVNAETVINGNLTVVAQFRDVDIYKITAEYYYLNDQGEEVIFNTDLLQVEKHELPYTITAPSTTQTASNEVSGAPLYYPETPTATIAIADFDANNEAIVRFKYVPYTAKYDFVYLLKDLTGNGYTEIAREEHEGVLNSYVTPTVKTFDYAVLELAQGETITTSGMNGQPKQELSVYYTRKNYQLTYDTKGGSYVGGVTVPYGTDQAVTSTVPTRTGYTFAGWYTDEACTQAAGSTVTVNGNTTLYAKWTGDRVDYTIVYMFEKYNNTGTESSYVYENSETGSGTVGDTVYANSNSIPDKTKTGWEKDDNKNSASSVVIAADGSSVLYVYYRLKTYTFTFTINGNSTKNRYQMNIKGTTYRGSQKYSFTAKLGQDISADWPINGSNATIWDNNDYYYFYYWSCQGTSYASKILRVTEELLPRTGTSITVTGYWRNNNNTIQVNYYLQNANDNGYTQSTLYSQTAPNGVYSPKAIAGYTYDHSDNDTDWFGNVTAYNFFYNRDTFQIDYFYGSKKISTINDVKFDADINKAPYVWTPTTNQCEVDDDYTFAGWFADEKCQGTPYTFEKMPSSNLKLYAKWNAPTYTVSFVDGDDTSTHLADDQIVEKYKTATAPETTPTKTGYIFDGWYTTAKGTDLYEWNNQITKDTTIYAHWSRKTLSYVVHYVDEENNSIADDKKVTNPNFVANQSINEVAIAIAGYRPVESSKTLVLTENDDENVITFVYSTKTETTSYTVRYLIADGETGAGTAVAEEKTVTGVPGDTASVIELAAAVDYDALYAAHPELNGIEFYPDEVEKTLVLTASSETNVFTFYYSSYKNAKITVRFVDMNGNPIEGFAEDTQTLKVGKTYTLNRTPIPGWEFNKAVVGTEYSGEAAKTEYKITEAVTSDGLTFTLFYQKKATITVVNQSKQYDGNALTLPSELENQILVEGLLEGDSVSSISYTYTNADSEDGKGRVNAGEATVKASNAKISGTSEGNDNYYTIRYISGILEVTKINVTIRVEPDRWVGNIYDGTEKKTGFTNPNKGIADYVIISHAGYAEKYLNDIWAAVVSKATYDESAAGLGYIGIAKADAGDYTYFEDVLVSGELPNDGNYSVNIYIRPGRLEIKPKAVTVSTGSASKPYDGTPLTKDEASITGLVNGESVTLNATGTITEVGSTENIYSITWDNAKETNYKVTEELGTLTVTEGELKVTVNNTEKVYNGSEQEGRPFVATITGTGETITTENYTVEGLGKDDVLTITYTPAKGTAAGEYTGAFAETYTITREGQDVSTSYGTPIFTPGKLKITKAALTITAKDQEYVYNGSPQGEDNETYTDASKVTVEGLQGSDVLTSITLNGQETNVGEYAGKIVPSAAEIGENTDNYNINYVAGKLKITPAELTVTITGNTDTETYNGSEQSMTGYTISIPEGATLTEAEINGPAQTAAIAKGTDVNTDPGYAMGLSAEDFSTTNTNYNVTFAVTDGWLKITKVTLTITADDQSYVYNGSSQGENNATYTDADKVTVEGLQGSDALTSITLNGRETNVGEYSGKIVPSAAAIGENTDNYDIIYVAGKLTITQNTDTVKIESEDGEFEYDGNSHTKHVYKISFGEETGNATYDSDYNRYIYTLPTGDLVVIIPDESASVTHVKDSAPNNNIYDYEVTNSDQYSSVSATYGTLTVNPCDADRNDRKRREDV